MIDSIGKVYRVVVRIVDRLGLFPYMYITMTYNIAIVETAITYTLAFSNEIEGSLLLSCFFVMRNKLYITRELYFKERF
jgi:hypothetical protein